jgi:hypothetical protein
MNHDITIPATLAYINPCPTCINCTGIPYAEVMMNPPAINARIHGINISFGRNHNPTNMKKNNDPQIRDALIDNPPFAEYNGCVYGATISFRRSPTSIP